MAQTLFGFVSSFVMFLPVIVPIDKDEGYQSQNPYDEHRPCKRRHGSPPSLSIIPMPKKMNEAIKPIRMPMISIFLLKNGFKTETVTIILNRS